MPAGTRAIRDVELVSVGTWAASTGTATITRADLEDVLAAHRDGLVDAAPIKLGHRSKLNEQLGDGAPAFGWVIPKAIRRGKNGADTLVGDLVGIPAKLAEVAPTAYRRRSVELAHGVKTAAGKSYRAVLTAVSLLGVTPPAVKGLEDVLALYSGAGALEAESAAELTVVDGLEDNPVAVAMLTAAANAGASVEQLDGLAAAAGARDTAAIPTPSADDAETQPQTSSTPAATPTPEATAMPRTYDEAQLRELLSLEADADVDAALRQLATPQGSEQPAEQPTEGEQQQGDEQPPASTPTGEPEVPEPAGSAPELVTLSAGTYAELTALAEERRQERRARVLDEAVRSGRIAPAERTAFAAQLERDEEGTTTLLSNLSPRFAVTELGSDTAPDAPAASDEAFDEFERKTFGIDR